KKNGGNRGAAAEPRAAEAGAGKVPVVCTTSRGAATLEHPHFVEVPASSSSEDSTSEDVINHLNTVRGKGMAAMYSWSYQEPDKKMCPFFRSYKNGFVWHDLAEDDLVLPATDSSMCSRAPGSWTNLLQYEFLVSLFNIFLTMDKPAGAVTPSATAQDLMKKILYRAQKVPTADADTVVIPAPEERGAEFPDLELPEELLGRARLQLGIWGRRKQEFTDDSVAPATARIDSFRKENKESSSRLKKVKCSNLLPVDWAVVRSSRRDPVHRTL
ncbi:hypothetical protein QYE76_027011, partial [Lolium multiflorum]